MKKLWLFVFILTVYVGQVYSQCTPCNDPAAVGVIDYNSARISVLSGGNIEFNFQNISDYSNGLTLSNQSVLGLTICDCSSEAGTDPVVGSTIEGWDLYFDTDNTDIVGSDPANTIPLCYLEAEATVRAGLAGITLNGRQPLQQEGAAGAVPLASEATGGGAISDKFWSTDQLNISYYFAVLPTNAICTGSGNNFPLIDDGSITGDYYTVTVSFTLVPRCTVCTDTAY